MSSLGGIFSIVVSSYHCLLNPWDLCRILWRLVSHRRLFRLLVRIFRNCFLPLCLDVDFSLGSRLRLLRQVLVA